jgi:hypothetical protein
MRSSMRRGSTRELESRWVGAGLGAIPLRALRGRGDEASRLAGFVGGLPSNRDVSVLMPVSHDVSALERLSDAREGARLTRALLPYSRVRVTLLRDHPGDVHPPGDGEDGSSLRITSRGTHTVVVLVDKLDRAVLQAARYALSLGATRVLAVHAAVDPERAGTLMNKWMDSGVPIPLDVIECYDRNAARSLEQHVIGLADRGTEVTVVMARRDFPSLRQRLLHDRTSRSIMRALGRYPHVDVTAVPYFFGSVSSRRKAQAEAMAGHRSSE